MKILFLSTWFPYPQNQGSKIRAYQLLRALAIRHQVTLVSFADTKIEPTWLEHVQQFCNGVEIVQRGPFSASRLRTGLGWLSARPSSVVGMYSAEMANKVEQVTAQRKPDRVVALTCITAPYAASLSRDSRRNGSLVIDVDNVLSRMAREAYQQAKGAKRIRRWVAWRKSSRYEKWLFSQFNLCLAVSDGDCRDLMALLRRRAGIAVVPNGVDTVYNRPNLAVPEPNTLVFNGALTYAANYDAVDFFLREIFPLIRAQIPEASLRITGSTENVAVEQIASDKSVILTGYLEDIRPVLAESWVCVVPLRIGGGTRVKVLEAMALGTPVVSTSKGAEGLEVVNGKHLLIADTPAEFAAQVLRLLNEPETRVRLANNARRLVEEKYNWGEIGRQFCTLVENLGQ